MTTEESGQESSPQPKPTKPYPGVAAMHRSSPAEEFQYAPPSARSLPPRAGKVAPAAALVASEKDLNDR